MRLIAFVLIWTSLALGAVAATTVYSWSVPAEGSLDHFWIGTDEDGQPRYAVLWADAGRDAQGDPVATADTPLDADVVRELQAAGVKRVRVKSLNLGRWTHLPLFAVACVGLVAGGLLTRLSAAREARALEEGAAGADTLSPDQAIVSLRAVVADLLEDLNRFGDDDVACAAITSRVGNATRDLTPALIESRDRLVSRMGLSAYAAFMDVFASAERSLNRAWSAAADGVCAEAIESLERASDQLAAAESKLTGKSDSLLPLG